CRGDNGECYEDASGPIVLPYVTDHHSSDTGHPSFYPHLACGMFDRGGSLLDGDPAEGDGYPAQIPALRDGYQSIGDRQGAKGDIPGEPDAEIFRELYPGGRCEGFLYLLYGQLSPG